MALPDDPAGTLRREDHADGYSLWVRVVNTGYGLLPPTAAWVCVWSTARGNCGNTLPVGCLYDTPIIGVVPGSPADVSSVPLIASRDVGV
jgi:hypothetical protein